MFLNEYEINDLTHRIPEDAPNLRAAVEVLQNLMEWTNQNSDGWAYWLQPRNAAGRLIELVNVDRYSTPVDCTEADLKKAYAPIKSFLTKRKVDHELVFNPPPSALETVVESHVRLQEVRKILETNDDAEEGTILQRIRDAVYGVLV